MSVRVARSWTVIQPKKITQPLVLMQPIIAGVTYLTVGTLVFLPLLVPPLTFSASHYIPVANWFYQISLYSLVRISWAVLERIWCENTAKRAWIAKHTVAATEKNIPTNRDTEFLQNIESTFDRVNGHCYWTGSETPSDDSRVRRIWRLFAYTLNCSSSRPVYPLLHLPTPSCHFQFTVKTQAVLKLSHLSSTLPVCHRLIQQSSLGFPTDSSHIPR